MPVSNFKRDLFIVPGLRRLILNPFFPAALQLAMLSGMAFMVYNGWNVGTQAGLDFSILRKTSLTTLFVWGLWWPGMIITALLAGRVWCTVCPMELLNRLGHAAGRRAGFTGLAIPPWIRAGWLTVLAYLALQLLVAGFNIHRVPHYTALMLLAMLAAAVITGVLFAEHRSFCKSACPAKALLSVYGRFTPLQLDIADASVCRACLTKDCVAPANRDRWDRRSCPSLAVPYARAQSDECTLCFQCAKVCPAGNVGYGMALPGSNSRLYRVLRPFEAFFVVLASGFVAHETIGEMPLLEKYFHYPPELLSGFFPALAPGWTEAAWFLLFVPALLWASAALIGFLLGYRGKLKDFLLEAATGAAPVVAVAHLGKALAKFNTWGLFLPLSLRDMKGLETMRALLDKAIKSPGPLLPPAAVGWLITAIFLAFLLRNRRLASEKLSAAPAAVGLLFFSGFYGFVLFSWTRL